MAKQKKCGVYKITNVVNNKIYVGSSKDIDNRWRKHVDALEKEEHENAHLQHAWKLYGRENFKFETIEECDQSVQFEREQYYLNTLNPFGKNGYNIVRQISKKYMSDNYMVKKCEICGKEYHTFSHLSKYCEECKEDIKEHDKKWRIYWDPPISEQDARMWGYDSLDDFWESVI